MNPTEQISEIIAKYRAAVDLTPEELESLKQWMNSQDQCNQPNKDASTFDVGSASAFEGTETPVEMDREESDEELDDLLSED